MANALKEMAALALYGGPIVGLVVGVVYFVRAERTSPLRIRIVTSAFGPSLVAIFVVAGFLWPDQYRYTPAGVRAYYWLQTLPLLLLAYTLAKYPGRRSTHIFLVPVGLLAWAGTFAMGWLLVHGE
jgi:hypothetical protein